MQTKISPKNVDMLQNGNIVKIYHNSLEEHKIELIQRDVFNKVIGVYYRGKNDLVKINRHDLTHICYCVDGIDDKCAEELYLKTQLQEKENNLSALKQYLRRKEKRIEDLEKKIKCLNYIMKDKDKKIKALIENAKSRPTSIPIDDQKVALKEEIKLRDEKIDLCIHSIKEYRKIIKNLTNNTHIKKAEEILSKTNKNGILQE